MRLRNVLKTLGLMTSLWSIYQGFTSNLPLVDVAIMALAFVTVMSIPSKAKEQVHGEEENNANSVRVYYPMKLIAEKFPMKYGCSQ